MALPQCMIDGSYNFESVLEILFVAHRAVRLPLEYVIRHLHRNSFSRNSVVACDFAVHILRTWAFLFHHASAGRT
jgi:hypothetical protein